MQRPHSESEHRRRRVVSCIIQVALRLSGERCHVRQGLGFAERRDRYRSGAVACRQSLETGRGAEGGWHGSGITRYADEGDRGAGRSGVLRRFDHRSPWADCRQGARRVEEVPEYCGSGGGPDSAFRGVISRCGGAVKLSSGSGSDSARTGIQQLRL